MFYFYRRSAEDAKNHFLMLSAERAENNKGFISPGIII